MSLKTRLNHLSSVPGMQSGLEELMKIHDTTRHATLSSRDEGSWERRLNSSCHYNASHMDFDLGERPETQTYMAPTLSKYLKMAAMMIEVVGFLVTHFAELQSCSRCKSLLFPLCTGNHNATCLTNLAINPQTLRSVCRLAWPAALTA